MRDPSYAETERRVCRQARSRLCWPIFGTPASVWDMLVVRSRLAEDLLGKLGLEPGGVAMVHCRMSSLGRVVGGAETVVRPARRPGARRNAYGLHGLAGRTT